MIEVEVMHLIGGGKAVMALVGDFDYSGDYESERMTSTEARQLAARLVEAADEVDA